MIGVEQLGPSISGQKTLRLGRQRIALQLIVVLAVGAGLFVAFYNAGDTSLKELSILTSIYVLAVLVLLTATTSRGIWSVSAGYLLIFSLFHFGATFVHGFDLKTSGQLAAIVDRWFFSAYTQQALLLSFIAFFACATGMHVAYLVKRDLKTLGSGLDSNLATPVTVVGFILVAAGVLSWFANVAVSGSLGLLVGPYRTYLDAATNPIVSYLFFAIGLGLPLLAAAPRSGLRNLGVLIFALWSIAALPLGLRGEVLIPLCAALIVAAKKRVPFRSAWVILGAIILLALISVIRQVRQQGLRDFSVFEIDINPGDGLLELGGTLRVVTEVTRWHAEGEAYINGTSYWAPIERMLALVIPGSRRLPAVLDQRLSNVLILHRVGPIGFSSVAEAFRNFGELGVAAIMFATGFVLGKLDTWPPTRANQLILAVLLVPLLLQVRNSFTQVPFQIGVGLLLAGSLIVFANTRRKNEIRMRSGR